jgi:hypothetical protein
VSSSTSRRPVIGNSNVVPFNIPYGGFGTILNKAAIEQLSKPINCSGGSSEHRGVCSQLDENRIGESAIFKDGMSLFELFYLYSSVENFCFHSDWLVGYMLEFYIKTPASDSMLDDRASHLIGMETYPSCGNMTVTTGATRPCTRYSHSCHNLGPHDMESLSLFSFAKSQSDYDAIPMLASTDLHQALAIIANDEEAEENEVRWLIFVTDLGVPSGLYFAFAHVYDTSSPSQLAGTRPKLN